MYLAWCQEVLCASSQALYEADGKTEAQRDLITGQSHTAGGGGTRAQTPILFEHRAHALLCCSVLHTGN